MGAIRKSLPVLATAAVLTACGGGGGGGGGSTQATANINSVNYPDIIEATSSEASSDGSAYSDLFTSDLLPNSLGATPASEVDGSVRDQLVRWAIKRLPVDGLARVSPNLSGSGTVPCYYSGEAFASINVANEFEVSSGDRVTVDFRNCDGLYEPGVIDLRNFFFDGEVSIRVLAFSENQFNGDYNIRLRVIFDNVTVDDGIEVASLDGELTGDESQQGGRYSIGESSPRLSSTVNGERYVLEDYDFDFTETSNSFEFSVNGAVQAPDFTGVAVIQTLEPFAGTAGSNVVEGVIRILGRDNRSILLTFIDPITVVVQVDVDGVVDQNGDIAYEITDSLLVWEFIELLD